ncbi:hypothetical protein [Cellulomonas sp. Root137]|uniref:hypothetical protein n=1 Tax=Cellulomonas sp. Root137 TaxID=1736459 RepID=UPI0006FF2936|nr:hypothetical protein [Cellulomonas sp. Root137]KQY41879.1 hypothetical protein ASD18_19790 [Cellulomonas sp. Root137]
MIGDLMLTWMSEVGTGSVRDARSRVQWLARTTRADASEQAAGRWLRDISVLGHCEVDWDNDRWAIAPPAIVTLPMSDGHATIVGARRVRFAEALANSDLWVDSVVHAPTGSDIEAPATLLVAYDTVEALKQEAADIELVYSGAAATRLAAQLPTISATQPAAPPAWSNTTVEYLDELTPSRFRASGDRTTDGLYRFEANGRMRHLLCRGGNWFSCDRSVGIFLELARVGTSVMRWRPESGSGRSTVGTVFVDFGAALPPLQSRTLALCSGFVPRFHPAAQTAAYANVPLVIARFVAQSVLQEIEVIT